MSPHQCSSPPHMTTLQQSVSRRKQGYMMQVHTYDEWSENELQGSGRRVRRQTRARTFRMCVYPPFHHGAAFSEGLVGYLRVPCPPKLSLYQRKDLSRTQAVACPLSRRSLASCSTSTALFQRANTQSPEDTKGPAARHIPKSGTSAPWTTQYESLPMPDGPLDSR